MASRAILSTSQGGRAAPLDDLTLLERGRGSIARSRALLRRLHATSWLATPSSIEAARSSVSGHDCRCDGAIASPSACSRSSRALTR